MDDTYIGTVESAHTIIGRGTVLLVLFRAGTKPVVIGSVVRLVLPNITFLDAEIRGIELGAHNRKWGQISLLFDIFANDVPEQTRVHLLELDPTALP